MENYDFFNSNKNVVIKGKRLTEYDIGLIVFDDEPVIDRTDPDNPVYGPVPDHIKKYVLDLVKYCYEQTEQGTISLVFNDPDNGQRIIDFINFIDPNVDFTLEEPGRTQTFIMGTIYGLAVAIINIGTGDDDIERYAIVNIER